MKQTQIHSNTDIDFREIENGRIKLEGQYDASGLYQGTHRFWDENKRIIFEADFKDGVQTAARKYFPNTKPESEKHFKSGVPHGPHKEWYPGGEIKSESSWNNGKLHGLQKQYYGSGILKSEKIYETGSLVSSKEWDVSGSEL